MQFKTKDRKKLLLLIPAVLLLVILAAYLLLFRINRFTLELRLQGETETVISVGDNYSDPGARLYLTGSLFWKDGIKVDGEVRASGVPDTARPGVYRIRYSGSYRELEASSSRQVTVVDVLAPMITLSSIPGHYTIPGNEYSEEGYTAWDDCDGDITHQVIREVSDGFVTYSVTDQAGNRTTVGRKIYYYDPIPPQITLEGAETVAIKAGEGYQEPGWTASDNVDGDISSRVKVEGFVDQYLAGSYQLAYTVRDSAGNCAQAYRTVLVQAKNRPEEINPSGKVIYLTFDDGPGPYTEELLEILEKYDAKATFFVMNTDYVHLIPEIVKAGHAIGIHTLTHTYQEIYACADAYFTDLLTMQQLIRELSGVETYLMRFPGGSSNTVSSFNPGIMTYLTQAVEDMGFHYFDWNVDSDDAGRARDAETVYENVIDGIQGRRIAVVLHHDIKSYTVEAMEKILQWGEENGYRFLALDMSSPAVHHPVNN